MLRVEVDRDAPFEGCTGNAQILKSRLEEVVDHLVLAGFRLDEIMFLNVFFQSLLILGELEEVGFFLFLMHFSAAVRALAVDQLRICPEGLTRCTIPALIFALVNVALIIELLEDLLDLSFVVFIGRSDEAVVGSVHQIPDPLDLAGLHIDELLWRYAGFLGFFFDLLAMFVRSGLEVDIIAKHPLVTGYGIRHDDLIGIADVRFAAGISDRCGNVVFSFVLHNTCLQKIKKVILRAQTRGTTFICLFILFNADLRPCLPVDRNVQDPSSSISPAAFHHTAALFELP